jgi:DNA ligase (NAD+)
MKAVPQHDRERILELRKLIAYHQARYHEEDAPEISDEAYDSLVSELAQLETKYPELRSDESPLERVGGEVSDAFKKVRHRVRQWSFDNVFTHDELRAWEERVLRGLEKKGITASQVSYVGEHKIDGESLFAQRRVEMEKLEKTLPTLHVPCGIFLTSSKNRTRSLW